MLPPGWEEVRTPDGRTYYKDHNTRTTTWQKPPDAPPPYTPPPYAPQPSAPMSTAENDPMMHPRPQVVINRVPLNQTEMQRLRAAIHPNPVIPGNYWYDGTSGAWGMMGGPCMGIMPAGVAIGGPLPADASGGGTGVFINGREIHPMDCAGLQAIGVTAVPGRWWVAADGSYGMQGIPLPIGNLKTQAQPINSSGPWLAHSRIMGTHIGGDGQGFTYMNYKDHHEHYKSRFSG
jgi:hypothetical protein